MSTEKDVRVWAEEPGSFTEEQFASIPRGIEVRKRPDMKIVGYLPEGTEVLDMTPLPDGAGIVIATTGGAYMVGDDMKLTKIIPDAGKPKTRKSQRQAAQRYRQAGDRLDVVLRAPDARAALARLREKARREGRTLADVVGGVLAAAGE